MSQIQSQNKVQNVVVGEQKYSFSAVAGLRETVVNVLNHEVKKGSTVEEQIAAVKGLLYQTEAHALLSAVLETTPDYTPIYDLMIKLLMLTAFPVTVQTTTYETMIETSVPEFLKTPGSPVQQKIPLKPASPAASRAASPAVSRVSSPVLKPAAVSSAPALKTATPWADATDDNIPPMTLPPAVDMSQMAAAATVVPTAATVPAASAAVPALKRTPIFDVNASKNYTGPPDTDNLLFYCDIMVDETGVPCKRIAEDTTPCDAESYPTHVLPHHYVLKLDDLGRPWVFADFSLFSRRVPIMMHVYNYNDKTWDHYRVGNVDGEFSAVPISVEALSKYYLQHEHRIMDKTGSLKMRVVPPAKTDIDINTLLEIKRGNNPSIKIYLAYAISGKTKVFKWDSYSFFVQIRNNSQYAINYRELLDVEQSFVGSSNIERDEHTGAIIHHTQVNDTKAVVRQNAPQTTSKKDTKAASRAAGKAKKAAASTRPTESSSYKNPFSSIAEQDDEEPAVEAKATAAPVPVTEENTAEQVDDDTVSTSNSDNEQTEPQPTAEQLAKAASKINGFD